MSNKLELIGQRFGRGIVIKKLGIIKAKWVVYWELQCDCGNIYQSATGSLRSGNCQSCGCLQKEFARNLNWNGYESLPGSYFYSTKYKAELRHIEFNITIRDMWNQFVKQNGRCALSGQVLCFTTNKIRGNASLDRINNGMGYRVNNIQWIHKTLNKMKTNLPQKDFITMCLMVTEHITTENQK